MFLAVSAKFIGTVIWEDDIQIVCKWARFSKAPQRVAVSVTLNFITIVFVTSFGVNLKGRRSTIKDDPKWKSRVNKTVNEKLGQINRHFKALPEGKKENRILTDIEK